MVKEIKCSECGEVVIVLAKGSKLKPNVIAMHDKCPTFESEWDKSGGIPVNGVEKFRQQMNLADCDILGFLGVK